MSFPPSHTRLQLELLRLYGSDDMALAPPVGAAVLELARPADWRALGAVWRGVQADLGLPAPAIAVNGSDSYQLWFALADDSLAAEAAQLLLALCHVYLPGLKPATRLRLWSAASDSAAPSLPPQRAGAEQWSAFVAPDLAPVFSEEPWLDTEPGPDAQAEVLSRLACIGAAPLRAALVQLQGSRDVVPAAPLPSAPADAGDSDDEPRRFLLRVMKDETVPMALRIEAAKALLQAPR